MNETCNRIFHGARGRRCAVRFLSALRRGNFAWRRVFGSSRLGCAARFFSLAARWSRSLQPAWHCAWLDFFPLSSDYLLLFLCILLNLPELVQLLQNVPRHTYSDDSGGEESGTSPAARWSKARQTAASWRD